MDLGLSFRKAVSLFPDREAVVDGDLRFTYAAFGARTSRLANAMGAAGLEPGDVVSILAPNVHEVLEAYYATALTGLVLAPLNIRMAAPELTHILRATRARLLLVHADLCALAAEALNGAPGVTVVVVIGASTHPFHVPSFPYETWISGHPDTLAPCPSLGSDTLAHLYFTSGTTGQPKGVMLTHGNVTFHALAAIAELHLSDADTWLHAAPLFHLADAWATFAITWVGGRHVCLPTFDAGRVLDLIARERVTLSNWIPTMLNAMVNHRDARTVDASSLRVVLSGGAPIAPRTVRRIVETFGCDYIQTYGMTETSPYLTVSIPKAHLQTLSPDDLLALKSRTGRPFLGVDLRVIRDDGQEVRWDDREVGEIVVRGPTVTPGYWEDPDATRKAFRDGWLLTGDLAVVDPHGYVNIVDRRKDMILTGGENVYCAEVEYALHEHPDVLEAVVFGVPDEKWGEAVKAVVVPRPGATPAASEIISFLKTRLSRYKVPKTVDFRDALPRTGSGKIAKRLLRDAYWGGRTTNAV